MTVAIKVVISKREIELLIKNQDIKVKQEELHSHQKRDQQEEAIHLRSLS